MTPHSEDHAPRPAHPAHELILDVPSPRRPVAVGILSLWLAGWAFGVAFMLQQMSAPGPLNLDRLFLLAWLFLWIAAGVGVMGYLAWLLAGRERAWLEGGRLAIRRGVLGVGRTRRWPLESIRRLRSFGREIPPMIALGLDVSGRGASGVRFECDGRVVRFARALGEREAREVVDRLRERHGIDRDPHGEAPGSPRSHSAA